MSATAAEAAVREFLSESGLDWEPGAPGTFVVTIPGVRKLRTTAALTVGEHALTVNAFVARHPDENHEAVYRWLLERNQRMYAVAFAVDHLGDIYLVGRLPLSAVTPDGAGPHHRVPSSSTPTARSTPSSRWASPVPSGASGSGARRGASPPTTSPRSSTSSRTHRASGPEPSRMRQDEAMTIASAPYTLILLRHGESEWNAKNLFTGWVDVDLSEKGMAEARRGGELLAEAGLLPDVVHHLAAQAGDQDRPAGPRVVRSHVAARSCATGG